MEIRIAVLASGEILLEGKTVQLSTVKDALDKAEVKEDCVLYYRENAQAEPPPQAQEVINLIIARNLPLRMSSRPDFSGYVDEFGECHYPAFVWQPPGNPFEPAMPGVDLSPDPEHVFAEARKSALREPGARGVVIVKPDRGMLIVPSPPASAERDKQADGLPSIIPKGRPCNIAVIGNTLFTMAPAGEVPDILGANKAIPFFGLLIGWSYAGHCVWVFEGHPSALAAGLRDSEFLLVDSGMLPFLQADWMAVAKRAMKSGGKVFLHAREKYELRPLAASSRPPGWRIAEPDGERSYANCLLTTLARGTAESVTIESGSALPDLAALAIDPEELDWIAGLPFRYDLLDAQKVIDVLVSAAGKGKPGDVQKEWTLTTKLVSEKAEPRIHRFALRRERESLKTILHVSKR